MPVATRRIGLVLAVPVGVEAPSPQCCSARPHSEACRGTAAASGSWRDWVPEGCSAAGAAGSAPADRLLQRQRLASASECIAHLGVTRLVGRGGVRPDRFTVPILIVTGYCVDARPSSVTACVLKLCLVSRTRTETLSRQSLSSGGTNDLCPRARVSVIFNRGHKPTLAHSTRPALPAPAWRSLRRPSSRLQRHMAASSGPASPRSAHYATTTRRSPSSVSSSRAPTPHKMTRCFTRTT